jgi:hypothetical protein
MYGISRSTTSVLTYLIKYEQMAFRRALALICQKREFVYPNEGFVEQLKNWERELKKNDLEKNNTLKTNQPGDPTSPDLKIDNPAPKASPEKEPKHRSQTATKIKKPRFNLGIKSLLDAMVSRSELMSNSCFTSNLNISNMSTHRSAGSDRKLGK